MEKIKSPLNNGKILAVCPECGKDYQYFSHYRKPKTCNSLSCLYDYFVKLKNISPILREEKSLDKSTT